MSPTLPTPELPGYLHPEFDPKSLKMAEIHHILVQHHIKTPTGLVRKQQLVDLFKEHIAPQVVGLGDDEAPTNSSDKKVSRVSKKGTSKGDKTTSVADDESDSKPSTAKKTGRSASKSRVKRVESEAEDREAEVTRGRKTKKSVPLSSETEGETSSGKKVKSAKKHKTSRSSNFSDENPFQTGSESERSRTRSRKRDSSVSSRKSDRSRRSTRQASESRLESDNEGHLFKVPVVPHGSLHSAPIHRDSASRTVKTIAQPPTLRLRQDFSAHTKDLTLPEEEVDRPLRSALLVLTLALLFAYGIWFRQTRIDIGFCTGASGAGEPISSKASVGQMLDIFYPTCIPCPDRAICPSSDAEPVCPPEYVLKPHLLSFNNLFPLTPRCILSKEKEFQTLQLADAAELMLHQHAGRIECEYSSRSSNAAERRARQRIPIDNLKSDLELLKDSSISHLEFDQYWLLALKMLNQRGDSIVIEQSADGANYMRSLKPRRALGCRIRQAVISWIAKFRLILFALGSTLAAGLYIRYYINRRRKDNKIISGLVQNVLSKLSDQENYHYADPEHYVDSFLPMTHLRDLLLADVHSATRRKDIWDKVTKVIEANSNVRAGFQEVRGEPHRVWEWIGASGVLGVPKMPPRTGPRGSFYGLRREDSEFMNPTNNLYPSLSQSYD